MAGEGNSESRHEASEAVARRKAVLAELLQADEALVDRLLEQIAEKWGEDKECPYCNTTSWSVGSELLKISRLRGEKFQPFFGVMCDNCGNTVLIEPEIVGLWPGGGD